jgi:hypothetical protein
MVKYALIAALRLIVGIVQLALLLALLIALLSFLTCWILLVYVNRLYGLLAPSHLTARLGDILSQMFGMVSVKSKPVTSSSGNEQAAGTSDSRV